LGTFALLLLSDGMADRPTVAPVINYYLRVLSDIRRETAEQFDKHQTPMAEAIAD
jgi:hypothetical protein